MLNRDFTKTNSNYFKKNVVAVSIFSAFLVLGLLVIAIFGFNGNFEMKGYYEFSVNVTESTDYYKYGKVIEKTVDDFGGDFIQIDPKSLRDAISVRVSDIKLVSLGEIPMLSMPESEDK